MTANYLLHDDFHWVECDVMLDFRDYKTASRYAAQINAGYSARLNDKPGDAGTLPDEEAKAGMHGWKMADASMRDRQA